HCLRPLVSCFCCLFFFQAEDGIRDRNVTGVQTCALPILPQPNRLMCYQQIAISWKLWRVGRVMTQAKSASSKTTIYVSPDMLEQYLNGYFMVSLINLASQRARNYR